MLLLPNQEKNPPSANAANVHQIAQVSLARQAVDAIQDKEYAKALKILQGDLKAMAAKDPRFSPDLLLYLKAIAEFEFKKFPASEKSCNKLIANYPKSPWIAKAIFLKAKTFTERNDYEKALTIYQSQSKRLFAVERKAEIAKELIGFAQQFAKSPQPGELDTPAPNYQKAYKLFSEVLDLNCGNSLRAEARYQMTRMRSLSGNYAQAEKDALAYLREFDPTWRGLIGSPERVTLKKNSTARGTGKHIAQVRVLHGEALHRLNRRPEADSYLFELISLIDKKSISASKALVADATWLRLQTLRRHGGMAYNIHEWKTAAIDYLKAFPQHIHANRTGYLIGYMLNRHGKPDDAIQAYQNYLADTYHTTVLASPLTEEAESPTQLEKRKKQATNHLEAAHFAIGQIFLDQKKFKKSRQAWSETARLFPNGSKWANCQKGLVEIDYNQLIHQLATLHEKSTAKNELKQSDQATARISTFIAKYPLDSRIPSLLFKTGSFPYLLAEKLTKKQAKLHITPNSPTLNSSHPANPTDEALRKRKSQLYTKAIRAWSVLLSKYSQSSEAKNALYLTASLQEDHFGDMEKAIDLYKRSASPQSRTRLAALTSKRLIASSKRTFMLDETPTLTLNTRNIKKVKVSQYWLDLEAYFLKNGTLENATKLDVDLVEPDHSWEVNITGFRKFHATTQNLKIPFPQGKPGVCIIKIEDENYFTTSLVMRSNIDIALRAGNHEILAYVTNWSTGQPAVGVKLLLASGEKIISTETTDAQGVLLKKLPALKDIDDLRVLAISPEGYATCEQSLDEASSPAQLKPVAWFHTGSSEHRPGDTVKFYGVLRDARDSGYIVPDKSNRDYLLTCRTLTDHTIFTSPIHLDAQGGFMSQFKIPTHSCHRNRSIRIELSNPKKPSASQFSYTIPIVQTPPHRAYLSFIFKQPHVTPGDILKGEVHAKYRWGAPIAFHRVILRLPSGKTTYLITDQRGNASFQYDTTGIASESRITFRASLPSIASKSITHHIAIDPLQLFIKAEGDKAIVTKNEQVTIRVTTRDASTSPIGSQLSLKLIKSQPSPLVRCGSPVQIGNGFQSDHNASQSSQLLEKLIQTYPIRTDDSSGTGKLTFTIPEEGQYILRIEGVDQNGKPSITESPILVLGKKSASTLTAYHHSQKLYDDGKIDLYVFSKLTTPAKALLSLEADEILSYQIIDLQPGSNTIPLPIQPRYAPVFRASIMSLNDSRFYSTQDIITVSKKLNISSELIGGSAKNLRPGQKVRVRVHVTDTSGQSVPALLMAAVNPRNPSDQNKKVISEATSPAKKKTIDFTLHFSGASNWPTT